MAAATLLRSASGTMVKMGTKASKAVLVGQLALASKTSHLDLTSVDLTTLNYMQVVRENYSNNHPTHGTEASLREALYDHWEEIDIACDATGNRKASATDGGDTEDTEECEGAQTRKQGGRDATLQPPTLLTARNEYERLVARLNLQGFKSTGTVETLRQKWSLYD